MLEIIIVLNALEKKEKYGSYNLFFKRPVLNVKNNFITDIIPKKMEVLYVRDAEKFVGPL
jgi:hypothetical protein